MRHRRAATGDQIDAELRSIFRRREAASDEAAVATCRRLPTQTA
jgi:hypothetical protein